MEPEAKIVRPTTVVSVRGKRPTDFAADPDFVYVGRAMPRQGWKGSIWGNPFRPGVSDEDAIKVFEAIPRDDLTHRLERLIESFDPDWDAVEWFKAYVRSRESLRALLPELRGKTLGCWCGSWNPGEPEIGCHACRLAMMVTWPSMFGIDSRRAPEDGRVVVGPGGDIWRED
jgi:Domain of unknown function (DUF4326)